MAAKRVERKGRDLSTATQRGRSGSSPRPVDHQTDRVSAKTSASKGSDVSPGHRILAGLAVSLLAFALYAPTLRYGLVWDDPISIERWLPALGSLKAIFFPPPNIPQFPSDYYRPLQLISYQIDRFIGDGAPWAFHLTSIALHTLATFLVFQASLLLFSGHRYALPGSMTAAALFAAHPIHTESVAWMAARPDVMVACLGLTAFLLLNRERPSLTVRALLAGSCVFLGLLCKETAVALIVLLPASLYLPAPRDFATQVGSKQGADLRILPIAFLIPALLYLLLRWKGLQDLPSTPTILPEAPLQSFVGALGEYLRLLVFPYPPNAYISDVPTTVSALLPGFFGPVAILWLAWSAWQNGRYTRLWAIAWLVLTLTPSLAVVFKPPTAPLAERYLYLPSIGFCWLLADIMLGFLESNPTLRRQVLCSVATGVLVVAGGAQTLWRNPVWRDNFSLWEDTAARNTTDGMPMRNLATAALARGETQEAERLFREALDRRNTAAGRALIFNNLGSLAMGRNDLDTAETSYSQAMELSASADTLYNLGLIALRRGLETDLTPDAATRSVMVRTARERFQRAADASPHDPEIQIGLAQALQAEGNPGAARQHFLRAIGLGLPKTVEDAVRKILDGLA